MKENIEEAFCKHEYTQIINQRNLIQDYKNELLEYECLKNISSVNLWQAYSEIFLQDEVVEPPADFDIDNYKLYSFLKE